MESLALPLRVLSTGKLERVQEVDAVISLLGTMLTTSNASWKHAPWFGLLELVQDMNLGLSDQSGIRDAMNAALTELGIDWAIVLATTARIGAPGSGNVHLDLSLQLRGDVVFKRLQL